MAGFSLLGGLLVAFAVSSAAFYLCAILHLHVTWFVIAAIASGLLFSLLGVFMHRFFSRFFAPVFTFFSSPHGHVHCDDGYSWRAWLAGIGLLLALLALRIGALLQIHVVVAFGVLLFCIYAAGPAIARHRGPGR